MVEWAGKCTIMGQARSPGSASAYLAHEQLMHLAAGGGHGGGRSMQAVAGTVGAWWQ